MIQETIEIMERRMFKIKSPSGRDFLFSDEIKVVNWIITYINENISTMTQTTEKAKYMKYLVECLTDYVTRRDSVG